MTDDYRNRPRKGSRLRNQRLTLRLPKETKEQLQELADKEGLTLSDYVYHMLLDSRILKGA